MKKKIDIKKKKFRVQNPRNYLMCGYISRLYKYLLPYLKEKYYIAILLYGGG